MLMTVICGSPDFDGCWMAAGIRGAALGMPVYKHNIIFFVYPKIATVERLRSKMG